MRRGPEPVGDLNQWAQSLLNYLQQTDFKPPILDSVSEPGQDGQIRWYPTTNELAVHYNGSWYPIQVGTAL